MVRLRLISFAIGLGVAAAHAQVTPPPRNPGDCLSVGDPVQRGRCQAVFQPPSTPRIPPVRTPSPAGANRAQDPNANVKVPSPQ
jgi:hypothetical protein